MMFARRITMGIAARHTARTAALRAIGQRRLISDTNDSKGSDTFVALRNAFKSYEENPGDLGIELHKRLACHLQAENVDPAIVKGKLSRFLETCKEIFPPTDWKSTAELLASQETFGTQPFCVCWGSKCADAIKSRMRGKTVWFPFRNKSNKDIASAVWDPVVQLHKTGKPIEILPIIAGESGSGKTMLALCGPAMNLATLYFNGFISKTLPVAGELPPKDVDPVMQDAFVDEIAQHVKTQFLLGRHGPKDGPSALRLNLVFDEMGSRHREVRMLCRMRAKLCDKVREMCNAATVSAMALGTGIDVLGHKAGSDIRTFAIHTLQNDPCVWQHFLDDMREQAKKDPTMQNVSDALDAIDGLAIVQLLIGNLRAAVLLVRALERPIQPAGGWSGNVLRASVGHYIMQVAYEFKELNGLEELSHEELRVRCADALRYAMCPSTQPSAVETPSVDLVAQFGLLVDNSRVELSSATKDSDYDYHVFPDDQNLMAKVPKSGRFQMSPAVGVLTAIYIGAFRPLSVSMSTSGEELELIAAMKVSLVLTCVHTVAEAHEAMGFDQAKHFDASDTASLNRRLRIQSSADSRRALYVRRCSHQLFQPSVTKAHPDPAKPSLSGQEMQAIAHDLRARKAIGVVVINAKGAPYADLVAVAPGLVWLLQVKDTFRKLDTATLRKEYAKVSKPNTATDELLTIAGCKQAMFGVVARSGTLAGKIKPRPNVCFHILDEARVLEPMKMPERTSLMSITPGIPGVLEKWTPHRRPDLHRRRNLPSKR